MNNGFFRVAACTPRLTICNPADNAASVLSLMDQAAECGADLAVFPELCLSGYTCADLFHSSVLLDACGTALRRIVDEMPASLPLAVVGMPVRADGLLYNCAVFVTRGRVLGAVPKTYLPAYNEFYEKRWFAPAPEAPTRVALAGSEDVILGTSLLINVGDVTVGAEICEDLWAPVPPSCRMALSGAEVVANLSASDDLIGKYAYLRGLVAQQSARCLCGYVYSSAGYGESSTDLVFDAKTFVADNGHMVAEGPRWDRSERILAADIDIEALRRDRMHLGTFGACRSREGVIPAGVVATVPAAAGRDDLLRGIAPLPFVPADDAERDRRCEEIIHIQTAGLARRLDATRCRSLVVGVSGGLDSTLALLVAARAFDSLGLDRSGILGVTMPGFGTTGRTYRNAVTLIETLGATLREISIVPAVEQHFRDIGHDPTVRDVTYENSQARERTQILMDLANQTGGMVLGTGDLSELALGWATYNGDHMSMYGVNAGVPKTLVRHLVNYFAASGLVAERTAAALRDVVDTPVSPELLPAESDGTIAQKTEDLVGPYELHDFFLYYMLRYGFGPRRIFLLARKAWGASYDAATIKKWLAVFIRRFFSQQFKRSCLPDGPKVGSVTLSPRGDWRMPSDACTAAWLAECERL